MKFKSKWFEKCLKDFLNIFDREINENDLSDIKYLFVETTNCYQIGFSKETLPNEFEFSNSGDEWYSCCLRNTQKYKSVDEFLNIKNYGEMKFLSLKKDILKKEENFNLAKDIVKKTKEFEKSIKSYYAKDIDFEGLQKNESYEYGIINSNDFVFLKNLEVIRLMSCELEIHSIDFIKEMQNLKVLEIGEVRFKNLDGIEKLNTLDKLCIWAN